LAGFRVQGFVKLLTAKKSIKPEMLEHLVFLDESGVNTNLTRLYGRNLSSKRVVNHAPLNTPRSTTVLSSIRLTAEKSFTTYTGGTTGERFTGFLSQGIADIFDECYEL